MHTQKARPEPMSSKRAFVRLVSGFSPSPQDLAQSSSTISG